MRCWGACEQLYYSVTCKGVEAGGTLTRWQVGKPAEDTKYTFQLAEAQRWQPGSTDPQARAAGLETFLLTYEGLAPHQTVSPKMVFFSRVSALSRLQIIRYLTTKSRPSLASKAGAKQFHNH